MSPKIKIRGTFDRSFNSGEFLSGVLGDLPAYVMVLDRKGRLLFVNRTGPKTTPNAVLGRSLLMFYEPRYRPAYRRALAAAFRGKVVTLRVHTVGKGSEPGWFEDRLGPLRRGGRIVAAVSVSQRITDKVKLEQAENELKRLRERFENVFNYSSEGMNVTAPDGTFVSVNPAYCRIVGYSRRELVGRMKFIDITAPEFREGDRRLMRRMAATGHSIVREKTYMRKDGGRVAVNLTVFPLKDAAGNPAGFGTIVRDVTESKLVERQVREASEREQTRLGRDLHDGIGQYMTGISLLARSLQASLTAEGLRSEAAQAAQITAAANAAVRQTRSLAQGLIPTELSGGLRGALQELARNAKSLFGAAVRIGCPEKISIEDSKKALNIYRIAQEAVHNACRHGKARNIRIDVLLGRPGGMGLKIADDGLGLPRRLKPGLGLRTMAQRAAALGGTLEVLPRRGKGVMVVCRCAAHP